jgi:hypothetical protein
MPFLYVRDSVSRQGVVRGEDGGPPQADRTTERGRNTAREQKILVEDPDQMGLHFLPPRPSSSSAAAGPEVPEA